MFREVGKLYLRSFLLIFRRPQFLLITAGYLAITFGIKYADTRIKSLNSLALLNLSNLISCIISFALMVGFPLALLLMSNQMERGIDLKDVLQKIKEYFWKFFRQSLAGAALVFAYIFLFICLTMYFVFTNDATLAGVFLVLLFLVLGYFSLGSVSLGQRILFDDDRGAFQNSFQGLRMLNANFPFFAVLTIIGFLFSMALFPVPYVIGTLATGIDLFATPISDFPQFMKNVYLATQTPLVYLWNFLFGLIVDPFFTILYTLAYQRVKNRPPYQSSLKTERRSL